MAQMMPDALFGPRECSGLGVGVGRGVGKGWQLHNPHETRNPWHGVGGLFEVKGLGVHRHS